jgi:hypothetical protein
LVVVIVVIRFWFQFPSRYSILFFSPGPEIDQLAAIGAEWAMWIILPFSLTMASWAVDPKGHVVG